MEAIAVIAAIEAGLLLSARLSGAVLRALAELERARAAGAEEPLSPEEIRPLLEALTARDEALTARAHAILAEAEAKQP